ncbi:MAG: hypothetical protein AAB502_05620, partial [Chloroflexota bacterium]
MKTLSWDIRNQQPMTHVREMGMHVRNELKLQRALSRRDRHITELVAASRMALKALRAAQKSSFVAQEEERQ